ncbi:hypothetical protein M1558_04175 [Candidatus Parvarchaeota archaeon]|nr:hypothetical protein [Candidatus Parvarchaeota archaeon]
MKKSILIAVLIVIIIAAGFILYYYNTSRISSKANPFYSVSNSAELLNVTEHYVNSTNHFTINYSGTADIIFSRDLINVTLNVPVEMSFQKSGKLGLFQLYANLTKAYNFFSAFTGSPKEQNYISAVLLYNGSGIIACSNITGEIPQNCTFNSSKNVIDTIKNDLDYTVFRSYANYLFDTGSILNLGNSSFPVKFKGTESYNGNTCSIFDMNFSSSTANVNGNACFSDSVGMPVSLDFTVNGYTASNSGTAITGNYEVIFTVNSGPISYSNVSIAANDAERYLK